MFSGNAKEISGSGILISISSPAFTAYFLIDVSEKTVTSPLSISLAAELLEKLHHGVTRMQVMGMYSHSEKYMLICIIRKKQLGEMMKILKGYPGSFASFEKVNEVFGRFRK